jgi:ankyrin
MDWRRGWDGGKGGGVVYALTCIRGNEWICPARPFQFPFSLSLSLARAIPRAPAPPPAPTMPRKPAKTAAKPAGAGAPAAARPYRLPVSGLEVGLLDVGRFVALNGYADACRLLPFVSPSFYREEDFVVALKHVRYGLRKRTRLHVLARKGDVGRVALLLKVRADVNARDTDGYTPLAYACTFDHAIIICLLLDKGADPRAVSKVGFTCLHLATWGGHEEAVRLLLAKGVDPSDTGPTLPLTALYLASEYGHEGIARLLLANGADPNGSDQFDRTPLDCAAQFGRWLICRRLLDAGADPNGSRATAPRSSTVPATPLHCACEGNFVAVARLLLRRGANPNIRIHSTLNPLLPATNRGYEDIVRLLLDAGADANAVDRPGGSTSLQLASQNGHDRIVLLLLEKGARIGVPHEGNPDCHPLITASQNGHADVVRHLLAHGADAGVTTREGRTPLHVASHNGHEAVVRLLLLDKGTDPNAQTADDRFTPLHVACHNGHEAVVRLLLRLQPQTARSLKVLDARGRTPADLARKLGKTAVLRALQG